MMCRIRCCVSIWFWLDLLGKTESLMQAYCCRHACLACLQCSHRGACTGLAMSAGCKTTVSQRTYYMASLPLNHVQPNLRYKDICKRDLKACGIQPADVEAVTSDCIAWRAKVHDGVKTAEERREREWEERSTSRQQRSQPTTAAKSPTTDIFSKRH